MEKKEKRKDCDSMANTLFDPNASKKNVIVTITYQISLRTMRSIISSYTLRQDNKQKICSFTWIKTQM